MTAGRLAVGHPVDVATGILFHQLEDTVLPGQAPLVLSRRFSSALAGRGDGMFGPGWASPFEMRLLPDLDGYRVVSEEGDGEITFDDPDGLVETGGVVRNLGAFQELRREGGTYVVTRWDPDSDSVARFLFPALPVGWCPLGAALDATGQGVLVNRDDAGRVEHLMQRREGRGLRLVYNDQGRVVKVFAAGPDGAVQPDLAGGRPLLTYSYDDGGRLALATDLAGQSCQYSYDDQGRMVREVTLGGMVHEFRFDNRGRCVQTGGEDDFGLNRLEIMDAGRVTSVTDSLGFTTTYEWNAAGQVVRQISPLGNSRVTEFDAHGRVIREVTPAGAGTDYGYDERGDRVLINGPTGDKTVTVYNDRHQLTALTDRAGFTWTQAYDDQGRLTGVTNPLAQTLRFGYSEAGDLTWVENPAEGRSTFEYDDRGNMVAEADWEGNVTRYEYDPWGRMLATVDPVGGRTEVKPDLLGRPGELRLPDGSRRTYAWDAHHQPLSECDAEGRASRWRYQACGLLSEVERPDGSRFRLEYSSIPGQLLALVNGRGERHRFEYDSEGNLIQETDFAGRETHYELDADGQVVVVTDPAGQRTCLTRDPEGAVTEILYDDWSRTTFEYDPRGLLVRADNGQCPVERQYDAAGALVREKQGVHQVFSTFDASRNRVLRRSSLGLDTTFSWDRNGLLNSLDSGGAEPLVLEYDPRLMETARSVPRGVRVSREHDSLGRALLVRGDLSAGAGAGQAPEEQEPLLYRNYHYDLAGNLCDVVDQNWGKTHYDYDAAGRLTGASHPGELPLQLSHDQTDNLAAVVSGDAPALTGPIKGTVLLYEPGDQLVRWGKTAFSYDEQGRLVGRSDGEGADTSYLWNGAGQLAGLVLPYGSRWQYTYDALGRRVKKAGPTGTWEYVWDGDVVLHEVRVIGEGDELRREVVSWDFVPFTFEPLARSAGEERQICVTDATGVARELIDADGNLLWSGRPDHLGWVEQRVAEVPCPVRMPGQWYDAESGLYYNRFRYFDPGVGRYISPDPLGIIGGPNPYLLGINLTGWVDPLGLAGRCPADATAKQRRYLEYKTLRAQGYNAKDAHNLMKQFDQGVNPGGQWGFHFASDGKAAYSLQNGIPVGGRGYMGFGIYFGTTPTPGWFLKHFGWGIGKTPVRMPINLSGRELGRGGNWPPRTGTVSSVNGTPLREGDHLQL